MGRQMLKQVIRVKSAIRGECTEEGLALKVWDRRKVLLIEIPEINPHT